MKVLIVDDAALSRSMLKKIFETVNFEEVWEAPNGEEAVKIYQDVKPNMVTMDISLPGMDGIATIKKIMETDPKAKILVCSAIGDKSVIQDALKAGAKDFIVKPFDVDSITVAVKKVLS